MISFKLFNDADEVMSERALFGLGNRCTRHRYITPPPPPPEYVVQRPAPAAVAHSNMVEELTEHMKRMGKTPHGHGVPTAEYCEPYEGSESNSVFSIPATRRESVALQQNFRGYQQERVYRGPKPNIPHFTKEIGRASCRERV